MTNATISSVRIGALWRSEHMPFALLLLVALPLLLFNLATAPVPWFDEGLNLAAARTLAETGQYALPDAIAPRLGDPAIQTGPPIILPLALLYSIVGAEMSAMRLFFALTGFITFIAIYALAYRLYGRRAALVTAALLLLLPGHIHGNFVFMSRQVLGEVPAVLLMVLGLHLLLSTRTRLWHAWAVGLLFGLAISVKSQVLLILTITVGLLWLYHLARRDWATAFRRWFVILLTMGAVYVGDTLLRTALAGGSAPENTATLIEGALIHIIPFPILANLTTPHVLWRTALMLGVVGAVLWLNRIAPPPTPAKRRVESFLLLLVTLWALWFSLASIGWERYAFVGIVMALILSGRVADHILTRWLGAPSTSRALVLAALTMLIAPVVHYGDLTARTGHDFYAMIDYVADNVPNEASIVTWEWMAAFFVDQPLTLPDTHITNQITRTFMYGQPYDPDLYDPLATCPDYLLLGSFVVDRTAMAAALEAAAAEPVFQRGQYMLYRLPGCP